MKPMDDVRKMLRDADPARDREMPPLTRARMRSRVIAAATVPARTWARAGWVAAAVATACLVVLVTMQLRTQPALHGATPSEPVATAAPVTAVRAPASPAPLRAVPATHHRRRTAPLAAQPARQDEPASVTRIVFTGPDGTRILWFVGTPDAKELGS